MNVSRKLRLVAAAAALGIAGIGTAQAHLVTYRTAVGNYVFNAEVGASAPLNKVLSLRIVFQDTYDSQPAAGRVPNDMKIVGGVECKF